MSKSAIPLLAGAGALLLLSSKGKGRPTRLSIPPPKTRWGIKISDDCSEIEWVYPNLFDRFVEGAFGELIEANATLDLATATTAIFSDVVPGCTAFPGIPESNAAAGLYARIARRVGFLMIADPRSDSKILDVIADQTTQDIFKWAAVDRTPRTSYIPTPPPSEVAFSSDFSGYVIGDDWYTENVLPFVVEAASVGTLDTVSKDFSSTGVLVGDGAMPISSLPNDEQAVVAFIEDLNEAIDDAVSEVS